MVPVPLAVPQVPHGSTKFFHKWNHDNTIFYKGLKFLFFIWFQQFHFIYYIRPLKFFMCVKQSMNDHITFNVFVCENILYLLYIFFCGTGGTGGTDTKKPL